MFDGKVRSTEISVAEKCSFVRVEYVPLYLMSFWECFLLYVKEQTVGQKRSERLTSWPVDQKAYFSSSPQLPLHQKVEKELWNFACAFKIPIIDLNYTLFQSH